MLFILILYSMLWSSLNGTNYSVNIKMNKSCGYTKPSVIDLSSSLYMISKLSWLIGWHVSWMGTALMMFSQVYHMLIQAIALQALGAHYNVVHSTFITCSIPFLDDGSVDLANSNLRKQIAGKKPCPAHLLCLTSYQKLIMWLGIYVPDLP